MGRVCEDGKESDGFEITAGVKQGCVVSPSLFNLFFCCNAKKSHGAHATASDDKIPKRKHIQLFPAESLN